MDFGLVAMISYFSGALVAHVTQPGRAMLLKPSQTSFRVQGLCGEAEVWARRKKRKPPRTGAPARSMVASPSKLVSVESVGKRRSHQPS